MEPGYTRRKLPLSLELLRLALPFGPIVAALLLEWLEIWTHERSSALLALWVLQLGIFWGAWERLDQALVCGYYDHARRRQAQADTPSTSRH